MNMSKGRVGRWVAGLAVAGAAADVFLPIDAAAIFTNRRVPHPPPSGRDDAGGNGMLRDEWGGFIGHRENPSIMLRVLRQSTGFLK